jgi:hypothetical protein
LFSNDFYCVYTSRKKPSIENYIFIGKILPSYLSSVQQVQVKDTGSGGNMSTTQKIGGIEPLPRYVRPDAMVPEYDEILEQLQEYHRSFIGSSYYYIRVENDRLYLCRILPGGGKIFFHEIVDHEKHGISEDDLEEAVRLDTDSFSTPGYYPVSLHIETKLRVVLDYP